jgi:hypothetical protein
MFTAYSDESGSPDSHALVVAGFLASDQQWKEFERNWADTLRQFGITLFHSVEFAHSVREFSKWKGHQQNPALKEERQWFLRKLLAHIKLRTRLCYSHGVRMDEWRKVDEIYFLSALLQPYALCGRTVVKNVSEWAARNNIPTTEIQYVFEDGARDKGLLQKRIIKDKRFKPIFKKKPEAVPLQAADLLAYETLAGFRDIFDRNVTDFDDLRYPLRVMEQVPHRMEDWGIFSQKNLEDFCVAVKLPRRDSINPKDFEGMSHDDIVVKLREIWGEPAK